MIQQEVIEFVELYSQDVMTTLNSIQDLVLLAQRHHNPVETQYHLGLISTCLIKLQESLKKARIKAENTAPEPSAVTVDGAVNRMR